MNLYDHIHKVTASIPVEQLQKTITVWGMRSPDGPNPLVADLTDQAANPHWRRLLATLRDTVDRHGVALRQKEQSQGRAAA